MKTRHLFSLLVSLSLLFVLATAALAQTIKPDVQVAGTGIVDGTVTIVRATVAGPGWVVIHVAADGAPGPVIGYAPLVEGVNTDVVVTVDAEAATPVLYAMLHVDEGTVGTYEFPGADGPVKIGDAIVQARFSAFPVAITPEATEEAMEEAMAETTPEATEEAMEEAMAETTPEATEEAMEEAMAETTPEATEEAMEEATALPAAEAATAAPDALPNTGASPSTPLIFAVMAAVLLALGGSVVISRRVMSR